MAVHLAIGPRGPAPVQAPAVPTPRAHLSGASQLGSRRGFLGEDLPGRQSHQDDWWRLAHAFLPARYGRAGTLLVSSEVARLAA